MKWISIIMMVAILLVYQPMTVEAASTRVYVSISIGGALIVGGGFLAWSLSYGSRVSKKDPNPTPLPSLASNVMEFQGEKFKTFVDRSFQISPEGFQPLKVELPLLVYHWVLVRSKQYYDPDPICGRVRCGDRSP